MFERRLSARRILLALVVSTIAAIGPATSVPVLAKCDPGRADDGRYYFDGWYKTPGGTVGGVGSNIVNYSPWVHVTDDSVSAWTMTANGSLYAQVGWLEFPGSVRYTFTEYTTSDHNWHRKYFGAYPLGASTRYTTLYGNTAGYFTFLVNGGQIDKEPAQFVPNNGQNYGEIHTYDDQMPGGYNLHETFRNTQIYYSGAWHAFQGTGYTSAAPFHYSTNDSGQYNLDIWDGACAS
jgi:hypothetical protein